MRARLVSEEELPPHLPVRHFRGSGSGGLNRGRRLAGNAHRHDRLVAALCVVALGARPFIHHLVRRCICHLRLQRGLRLHGLSGFGANNLLLTAQQVQRLEAGIEVHHHQEQQQDADEDGDAAWIDRPVLHDAGILPAAAVLGKKGGTICCFIRPQQRCTLRLRYTTTKGLDPTMKVLLIKDVYKLGRAGDVKKVADGYGRNFLLTQGLAVLATAGTVRTAEKIRAQAEIKRAALNTELKGLSDEIAALTLAFPVKAGETGKLYGSITTQDIATAVQEQTRYEVKRQQIDMQPIRTIGEFRGRVRLTVDLIPEVRILVHREGESAEAAAQAAAEAAALAETESRDAEKAVKARARMKAAESETAEGAPAEGAPPTEEKPQKAKPRKKKAESETAESTSAEEAAPSAK